MFMFFAYSRRRRRVEYVIRWMSILCCRNFSPICISTKIAKLVIFELVLNERLNFFFWHAIELEKLMMN